MSLYAESLRAFLKPVLSFLDDDSVTEIMINGPEDVWIERRGRLYKTDAKFTEEGLLGAARNVAQFVGRPLTDERPRLDARLPDGSRIHVVLPPIALRGTTISIRKFFRDRLTVDGLLQYGTMNKEMARLVEAIILSKLNVIVSGGTGSGKTTLLNVLSSYIPDDERILTVEDSAELQLSQSHLVSLESRPADKYGKGAVDLGELLHSSLRLRPDRIVVGEVRGGEAFHLMQAMNTGHSGSLSTVHANTPTDTLRRIESLCLMSTVEMPLVAVRSQVASAINVIICCERMPDGTRKMTHISEVLPLSEKGDYRTQHIWVYTPLGRDERGNTIGYHAPTGLIPHCLYRLRSNGFSDLDDKFFDPHTYGLPAAPTHHLGVDFAQRWVPSLKHRERGQADPDTYKQQLAVLERKLREEAKNRPDEPNIPVSSPSAKSAAKPLPRALGPGPAPKPASGPRSLPPGPQERGPARALPSGQTPDIDDVDSNPSVIIDDDDKTPPPTKNPLIRNTEEVTSRKQVPEKPRR